MALMRWGKDLVFASAAQAVEHLGHCGHVSTIFNLNEIMSGWHEDAINVYIV